MEQNPHAAPQSQVLQSITSDEAVRQQHINTEATIKSVGTLYYLGTLILPVAGVFALTEGLKSNDTTQLAVGILLLAIGIGQGVIAFGLRRLRAWARVPTIIISCIGLLGFPLGTIINAYILAKVCGKQGRFVMTPEYQRIIAVTPHVKRKTSIVAMLLLAVFIIVLVVIIGAIAPR